MFLDRRRCCSFFSCTSSLQALLKSGFSPTLKSINRFLLFLLRLQKFDLIAHFISQINSNGIEGNYRTQSIFTWALLKSHKFDEAEQLMKNRIVGSTRMWDALIQGIISTTREDPDRAFFILEDCLRNRNVLPSSFTFGLIIHRLSSQGNMGRVIDVLELMADAEVKYPFDNFICSSVISGFCKIGKPELALGFFENTISSGVLQPNVVTYTALVSALGKLGDVKKATSFLAKMLKDGREPDKVTYTAIMTAYCVKGKLEEALTVFKNVNALGIDADEFMFATLINGFSERGDFDHVFCLLDEMEKREIRASIVTYNCVINGLCKFGRMSEADEFSKIVPADIITYSTLLHGYAEEENIPGILQTKRRLEEAQISMDVVMCNVLIKALFVLGAFEDAYAVYKWMPEMGLVANSVTFCTMIDCYCKVGRIDEALEIFDEFRKTSISSHACYNSIISGLCKEGIVEMATETFIELNDKGLVLDAGIYRMLMQAIFKEKGAKEALELVHRMEALGPDMHNTICNDSIFLLCKRGLIEDAYQFCMMMRMKGSSIRSKTFFSILRRLISDGKSEESLPLLNSFIKLYGLSEPRVHKIVAQYLCLRDVDCAFRFLAKTIDNSSAASFPVSLPKLFLKEGRALDAYRLIMEGQDYLPTMDVIDFTTVIDGLCKGGFVSKALDLCIFAEKKGITLNIVSYNSIINGLCIDGRLLEAFRLFDSLEQIGLTPSEITYATLIYALCREGYLLDANYVFRKMALKGFQPKLQVYNSLLDGISKVGRLEEALNILDDMETKLIQPNYFTVSAVINCYCQKGDLEGALAFFDKFKSKDILPDFLGFLYLIRGLCAKGRMEEARSILREMFQIKPIAELINIIESKVETESIRDCLVFLCEQGRIQEAVRVLNEIASILFPAKRLSTSNQLSHKQLKVYEGKGFGSDLKGSVPSSHKIDLDVGSCDTVNGSNAFTTEVSRMTRSQLHDFDFYYSRIAALCSNGELQEASQLAKELLSDLTGSTS
ncbi:pentatricopeptide repeat-containing protein At5g57250, mitochondrial [Prosopis cineraria]|uniref:pentatricopeptide repeat-containing protein At5g57250, mitochondrial n=1 Tax=Prosopis cineraria TaxID=364024 RepID=UPI00241094C2|nr:pentatricopeptide repeat-containing protein At5g57250, mitochondrial [Prosopis cineraria]XP_054804618.1 pentatricopeptide repeat-containing protein At5g57250, mitochondrial [Prosopis cineraria]XP_054804619.1 pentatricopeptide repeat-containing protein At5g57250, mitochondrial [Prosopis cineraria]XP_054804620.1 pentatricopeptide repeat-containing protein At5g57250, mitochondrial [Prosopis cineraria]XP_054804621.1 pentatricopeptide repeat-containing protein At5g57250, mitochondrial [Prosopis c